MTWLTLQLTLACASGGWPVAHARDIGSPFELSQDHRAGQAWMGIRLRGALQLAPAGLNGLRPRELSGLAWDEDEQRLYAVSDEGLIVHLYPKFGPAGLERVTLLAIEPLRDADGRRLARPLRDAEGLALRHARNGVAGDTELVIAFERTPRVARYSPFGAFAGDIALPETLSQAGNYAHPNKALEALTDHPEFGLLVAPERPLKTGPATAIPVFALDGRSWPFYPGDRSHGALVGMETMPDGDVLILERRYVSVFLPLIVTLTRMRLTNDGLTGDRRVREIARFDTSAGWAIDNFEGVAWHTGTRYFMVSDDNRSAIQKTLLVYFEIPDDEWDTGR